VIKTKKLFIFLFFIISVISINTEPTVLGDALNLFDQGDRDSAVLLLEDWLVSNPENIEYEEVYVHLLSMQPTASELSEKMNGSESMKLYSAYTAEMQGNYPLARELFYELALESEDDEILNSHFLDAAEMALKMGDLDVAKNEVTNLLPTLEGDNQIQGILLLTRILILTDQENRGLKILEKSLNTSPSIDGLYFLSNLLNQPMAEQERFSSSPENYLLSGLFKRLIDPISLGLTEQAFREISLDSVRDIPTPVNNTETTEDTYQVFNGKIQAGSFRVQENARELETVLSDLGWKISIEESRRNNQLLYKVLIINIDSADLQDELLKLKSQGFDGFILR